MSTLERIARYGAMAGFLFVSSGCIVAPDRGYDHDRDARAYRDRDARDRDHEEHHCDDRDHGDNCHDRSH